MSGDPARDGTPEDEPLPRARAAVPLLRAIVGAAVVAGVAGLVGPAAPGRVAAWTAIGLVLLGPPLRLALVARDWTAPGDRRFLAALLVLAVVLTAAATVGA